MLRAWGVIAERQALPRRRFLVAARLGTDRLRDQSSLVRKEAVKVCAPAPPPRAFWFCFGLIFFPVCVGACVRACRLGVDGKGVFRREYKVTADINTTEM